MILILGLFLQSTLVYSQGTVPINIPAGGFQMDGNLFANSPANTGDWFPGGTGTGAGVYKLAPNLGDPFNPVYTFRWVDPFNSSSDETFTSGTKSDDSPLDWKWTNGSATGKSDIGNVFMHIGNNLNSDPSDDWLVVASDRFSVTGTSYLEFEFFQNDVTRLPGGTFSSAGPDGGRTENDVLISISYTNGGSTVTIEIYVWKFFGGKWQYELQNNILGSDAFGAVNTVSVPTPIGAFGNANYLPYQFVEAAINISKIVATTTACEGVSVRKMMVKTRASASLSAAAVDFLDPVDVKVNFGTATIDYDADLFCGPNDVVPVQLIGVQNGTYSSTGGLAIDPTTGAITLSQSTPGVYTVRYDFTTANCNAFTTVEVTIPEPAPAPSPATFDYCVGSLTGEQAIPVSPANGYTLIWYAADGITSLGSAPTFNTDTPGIYTYKVSQIKDGECESEQATITINVGACSLTLVKEATNGPSGEECLDPTLSPTINYSFTVTNNGAYDLTNIQISDPLFEAPNPLVAIVLSDDGDGDAVLAVNETWVYTASYSITPDDIQAGQVENQATVSGEANGHTVEDLSGSATDNDNPTIVPICQDPVIEIIKTGVFNDENNDTYANEGETITYTFEVSNGGDVSLTNITVTDPLPGLSAPTYQSGDDGDDILEVGETWTYTSTYSVTQDDINAGQVDNTATADSDESDESTDDETVLLAQDASIMIEKSALPTTYNAAGDVITYTFDVTNTGNVTLTEVTVSDPLTGLSAITPAPVTLAPAESQAFTATYTITQADMDAGQVYNTATATGTDPDDVDVTDTDDETITVVKDASIMIEKSALPTTYNAAGDVITYTFDVTNTGNVTLTEVTVS
ncbi:DUF11 domain-containing protein, partial [Algoriphagus aestuarii]|nr:DUF11 domain-containing protein [Algoriphagus aestuarii]